MSARRGAPRSLFRREVRKTVVTPDDPAAFADTLRRLTDPAQRLQDALGIIERAGDRAATDDNIARGQEYAKELRIRVASVRHQCEIGQPEAAALEALLLAQAWMQLRADALFADPVRQRETFLVNRDDGQRERALAALHKHGTQAAAAAALGITTRQLRNLVPKDERVAIRAATRQNRNS